jgi:DNA-binding beta-propeller fold protein YncE
MKTLLLLTLTAGSFLVLQTPQTATAPQHVGRLPDGGFLLNSGWTLRPAGEQVPVDTLPMSSAVSRDGKWLLVLNGGYNPPSISVIDVATHKEVGRTPLPDCWLGLTVAPNDDRVYVGGGSTASVYELTLDSNTGALTRRREFSALAQGKTRQDTFIGDVALSPDAHLLYAADIFNDGLSVINLQSGEMIDHWKTGRRPYRILVSPGGKQLVVSSWADAAVYQHDANSGTLIAKTRVAPHPTDMLWLNQPPAAEEGEGETRAFRARIFVAAANTNNVYSLGVTQDGQLNSLESINVSLTPMHPLGMTPSALAVDKAGTHLYVACSDANAVAVADISRGHSRVLGFIPTGWYPTAVRSLNDGQLVIVNGKGLGSYPNPKGPNPSVRAAPVHSGSNAPPAVQFVAHIQTGTVAFLPAPDQDQLNEFSSTVMKNSPYSDDLLYGPPSNDEQQVYFSSTEDHASPIKHVIYIIKENRTYDQVLGDIAKGNGDKSLVLFGEQITPNLHRIADEFILYDNFYENADVSADGHNWASAAIAPDYTVKMWPSEYGHRKPTYDFEGTEVANNAPAGYIWDNALQKGLTVRDYGYWSSNLPLKAVSGVRQIAKVHDPVLQNHTDMNYRGWDLQYSDVDRAQEFAREWKEFDTNGDAPQFMIVRLGNDHTEGTRAGALTPFAFAAQNDQAVGMFVDTVSHSKLWSSTAIFIIEDDAQNGPDHVDSHRAPAFIISPYTHRGIVDSNMYNQTSILRTMELILGLRPMTHFDAAAPPMFATFSRQPDARPYDLIAPKHSLTERNDQNTPGAQESKRMNFSQPDLVDDDELTAVIWRAIKHTDPPPPTRSAFSK